MSELAAKLARRRMLNGEQPGATEAVSPNTSTPKTNMSPPPARTTSSSNELTSKLARRRELNGEAISNNAPKSISSEASPSAPSLPTPEPILAPPDQIPIPLSQTLAPSDEIVVEHTPIVVENTLALSNEVESTKATSDARASVSESAVPFIEIENETIHCERDMCNSRECVGALVTQLKHSDENAEAAISPATMNDDSFAVASRDAEANVESTPNVTTMTTSATEESQSESSAPRESSVSASPTEKAEAPLETEACELPTSDQRALEVGSETEMECDNSKNVENSRSMPVDMSTSQQSHAIAPVESSNGTTAAPADPLDDFADIESFLGSMNDQTSELLGGVDTLLSANRVTSTIKRGGNSLFEDDVGCEDEAEVSSMGTSELQKQNNQLASQLNFLKAEINAREKTIDKLNSELKHLREELRQISSDVSPRFPKKTLTPETDDLFSSTSDHHIADELFSIPTLNRPSQARKNNLFSADDDEGDSTIGHVGAAAMNELTKENSKLRNEVAVLTNDLRNRDGAVLQLRRDKSDLLEALAHEREIQERRSGRKSSSAKGVLKNQLDLMGFGSSEVEFAVEALQEDFESIDDSMQSLFSSPKLHTSRSDTVATYGLDSTWNMSQDGLFSRGQVQDDSAAVKKSTISARQRLDDHGLFSSDVPTKSSEGKNEFLFKDDVPTHDEPPKPRPNNTSASDNKSFDYQDFVYRLMSPECSDLVEVIRYVFHGTRDMASRCCDFFDAMIEHFGSHPAWADEPEERMKSARNCLEKYIMNKIADVAFKSVEVPDEDEALLRKMKCLSFVPASDEMNNDIVWALARDELRKINSYRTPGEKIDCVVRCAAVIFRTLNLARAKSGDSPAGADDFLPIFIYVVMHSQVPQLVSNCEYIQCFHNPDNLRSKAGYCFVNLRSAMEFILHLDGEGLTMDKEEFCAKLAQAERDYDSAM